MGEKRKIGLVFKCIFMYKGEILEVVKEYNYLWIVFFIFGFFEIKKYWSVII